MGEQHAMSSMNNLLSIARNIAGCSKISNSFF